MHRRNLVRTGLLLNLLLVPVLLPSAYGQRGEIVVGAAISLKEAYTELGAIFQQRTGTKVTFSFGASGVIEKQIEAGAPMDVFASAAEKEMNELAAKNLIDRSSRTDFARNTLELVLPAGSKRQIHSFYDLVNPAFGKIAIGDPKTVPAGQYAQQLLQNLHLWAKLQPRLILGENVRQVLEYVARGDVDAGIVYSTDVQVAHGRVTAALRAPDEGYGPIRYPVAVIQGSPNAPAAKQFVKFVASPEGTQILKKYGFEAAK